MLELLYRRWIGTKLWRDLAPPALQGRGFILFLFILKSRSAGIQIPQRLKTTKFYIFTWSYIMSFKGWVGMYYINKIYFIKLKIRKYYDFYFPRAEPEENECIALVAIELCLWKQPARAKVPSAPGYLI